VGSFAVATTITPSCVPTPSRQFSKGLETHRPFLRALALGRESAVAVFDHHQRRRVLGGLLEQADNIRALYLHVAQVKGKGANMGMRRHHPDGRRLSVPWPTPKQVAPAIRQVVLAEPFFPLEEKLEVRYRACHSVERPKHHAVELSLLCAFVSLFSGILSVVGIYDSYSFQTIRLKQVHNA
jgi:hypothetical protein